jgi:hypothetical protein
MSRLLKFPCHSIWTDYNRLTGSIPSELKELTSLTVMDLCTWIGFSCWHEYHACSHLLAIIFEQIIMNSLVPFRAKSENWRPWLRCGSVRGLVCLVRHECRNCSHFLAIMSHQIPINSRVQYQANLENWRPWLASCRSVRGLVYLVRHECRNCSPFLAIIFQKLIINSLVPFRANSENWRRWLDCCSVRGLFCFVVRMNGALAHMSLPLYLNSW